MSRTLAVDFDATTQDRGERGMLGLPERGGTGGILRRMRGRPYCGARCGWDDSPWCVVCFDTMDRLKRWAGKHRRDERRDGPDRE